MRACLELGLPMSGRRVSRGVLRVLLAAVFGFCASVSLLPAQSASTSALQGAPAVLLSAPESPAAHASTSINVAAPQSTAGNSWLWSQSPLNSGSGFGNDAGTYIAGMGSNSARAFGSPHQATGGFNRMCSAGTRRGNSQCTECFYKQFPVLLWWRVQARRRPGPPTGNWTLCHFRPRQRDVSLGGRQPRPFQCGLASCWPKCRRREALRPFRGCEAVVLSSFFRWGITSVVPRLDENEPG